MANSGTYPIDATTNIGRVRVLLGDEIATNVDAEGGTADFSYWGDDAIIVALYLGSDNIERACGKLVLQLAMALTAAGQQIGADGFSINTLGKGGDLLEIAQWYEKQALETEQRQAREEDGGFVVVARAKSRANHVAGGLTELWREVPFANMSPFYEFADGQLPI